MNRNNIWYTEYEKLSHSERIFYMKFNHLAAMALSAGMLITGCGKQDTSQNTEKPAESSAAAPSGLNLVTLGDSISFGYGLESPDTERYSALLSNMLEQNDNRKWNDYNYAVSGDDSSDLLKRLNNGKAIRLPSADVIVICIGANNLLGVFTSYLEESAEEKGININTIDSMTDEELESLQNEMTEKLKDTDSILKEIEPRIEEGMNRLKTDLDSAYDWIRARNQTAEIYILNVYNPYRGISDSVIGTEADLGEPFGDYTQKHLDRCNGIIREFAAAHSDLHLVDIEAAFAAADPVPILGADNQEGGSAEEMQYLDPHPNAEGQKLIAETLFRAMREGA